MKKCIHGHIMTEQNTYTNPQGRTYCKTCQKIAHLKWRRKPFNSSKFKKYRSDSSKRNGLKKKDLVRGLKNNPCSDCGVKYHYSVMDFDHLRDKKFNIGRDGKGHSFEDLITEISKCDLVCANCHRIRTFKRNNPTVSVDLDL